MPIIDLRNALLTIRDGSTNYLEVKIGEGNLTYSEKRNIELILSRGKIDTVREDQDEGIEVSFQFMWEHLHAGTGEPFSIEDVLKNRTSWTSASTDVNAPFCLNLQVDYQAPCPGIQLETILLPMFNYNNLAHSLRDATVACSGICNARDATVVRS